MRSGYVQRRLTMTVCFSGDGDTTLSTREMSAKLCHAGLIVYWPHPPMVCFKGRNGTATRCDLLIVGWESRALVDAEVEVDVRIDVLSICFWPNFRSEAGTRCCVSRNTQIFSSLSSDTRTCDPRSRRS